MTLQNRVLATGEIVAHPARGSFMGNRGILHDSEQRLGRSRWRHKAWIICELAHKGWHRDVMTPGQYTELFFLDEAVALAAGHRPCKLCRRSAYIALTAAAEHTGSAPQLDAQLHDERVQTGTREQRRHIADIADVPHGAIIFDNGPKLVSQDSLRAVTASGYGPPEARPSSGAISLITPPTACRALASGYIAKIHPSASL